MMLPRSVIQHKSERLRNLTLPTVFGIEFCNSVCLGFFVFVIHIVHFDCWKAMTYKNTKKGEINIVFKVYDITTGIKPNPVQYF